MNTTAHMLPDGTNVDKLARQLVFLKTWYHHGETPTAVAIRDAKHQAIHRGRHAKDYHDAVTKILHFLAWIAAEIVTYAEEGSSGEELEYVRVLNHREILMEAVCEFYGLDPDTVYTVAKTRDRLTGNRLVPGWQLESWNILLTAGQIHAAQQAPTWADSPERNAP
jgi:hypothetical protein